MSVPVEAQSLSSLTSLLANPPQYPRNPTHEVREQLVLYIVRVPGSKDVFLTPLKPPTKASISLEAIQSSLYYLHVLSDEDAAVLKSIDEQRRSEEAERVSAPIHRKPVPPVHQTSPPPSERPIPPARDYSSPQLDLDGTLSLAQGEEHGSRASYSRSRNDTGEHGFVHRRPLDVRTSSPDDRSFVPYVSPDVQHNPGTRDVSQHLHQQSVGGQGYSVAPRLSYQDDRNNGRGHYGQDLERTSIEASRNRVVTRSQRPSETITLIRRDPISGGQWNVGSISLQQDATSTAPLNPVGIELTTPGYKRFASAPGMYGTAAGLSDAASIRDAVGNGQVREQDLDNQSRSFSRVAEYQQQSFLSRPTKLHRRTDSSDSFPKPPSPTKAPRQIFTFLSPWQGICTFSNGIDGKSLKCRHTISSSNVPGEDMTAAVAELRFNLPWSILPSSSEKEPEDKTLPISKLLGPRGGKESFKRGFQHFKNMSKDFHDRRSSPDEEPVFQSPPTQSRLESEMDRLSLKLGREKAGGGFQGTSAKLGKLIIEDEGLKMCDLVVAACMGVWWQHYEGRSE